MTTCSRARVVGLTGGIGCGKTLVSSHLIRLGFVIVDADALTRKAYEIPSVLASLQQAFGEAFCEGQIDRQRLGALIFSDPSARARLNAIMWPALGTLIREAISRSTGRTIVDAAVLYEAGWRDAVEAVVSVLSPREVRVARVMARSGLTRDQVLQRMASQVDECHHVTHSDACLYNVSDVSALFRQTERVFLGE